MAYEMAEENDLGSAPNSLRDKILEYSKCAVISESPKEKQIADHHKELVSLTLGRGFSLVPPKSFFSGPRCVLRNASTEGMEKNIPPMLTASA